MKKIERKQGGTLMNGLPGLKRIENGDAFSQRSSKCGRPGALDDYLLYEYALAQFML